MTPSREIRLVPHVPSAIRMLEPVRFDSRSETVEFSRTPKVESFSTFPVSASSLLPSLPTGMCWGLASASDTTSCQSFSLLSSLAWFMFRFILQNTLSWSQLSLLKKKKRINLETKTVRIKAIITQILLLFRVRILPVIFFSLLEVGVACCVFLPYESLSRKQQWQQLTSQF